MEGRGLGFSFRSEFQGEWSADPLPDDFLARMERRVQHGLFVPGSRSRANYRVQSSSGESLTFEAADFLTAYNVGLNHVHLQRTGHRTIAYRVEFPRWARYCLIHGALLGVTLAVLYAFVPAMRRDVASYRNGPVLFWGLTMLWALGWPWIMTALHRPFARRALERILRDEWERGAPTRSAA